MLAVDDAGTHIILLLVDFGSPSNLLTNLPSRYTALPKPMNVTSSPSVRSYNSDLLTRIRLSWTIFRRPREGAAARGTSLNGGRSAGSWMWTSSLPGSSAGTAWYRDTILLMVFRLIPQMVVGSTLQAIVGKPVSCIKRS